MLLYCAVSSVSVAMGRGQQLRFGEGALRRGLMVAGCSFLIRTLSPCRPAELPVETGPFLTGTENKKAPLVFGRWFGFATKYLS